MVAPKRLPRVYIIRHGQTEWSLNGRHTGTTDIPLTEKGEEQVTGLGKRAFGPGKLVDPATIAQVLVSPRTRAQKTYELLTSGLSESERPKDVRTEERVREWTYGAYEGALAPDVNAERARRGEKPWDIWHEGCLDGESAQEMSDRVDEVVDLVKEIHRDWVEREHASADEKGGDVIIVSHGHFSRCFVARWIGLPIHQGQLFTVDVGGVSIGTYYHRLDRPSIGGINAGAF